MRPAPTGPRLPSQANRWGGGVSMVVVLPGGQDDGGGRA